MCVFVKKRAVQVTTCACVGLQMVTFGVHVHERLCLCVGGRLCVSICVHVHALLKRCMWSVTFQGCVHMPYVPI